MVKSSFFEYSVATSALFTSRGNIQINSHNIANADTEGYSRQYAIQQANTPLSGTNGVGMYGTGASIVSINQYRNIYTDMKYWQNESILGEYTAKQDQLSVTESIINELEGTGIIADANSLFDALSDLSLSPDDLVSRNNVTSSAGTMLETISSMGEQLIDQQEDINQEVNTMVEQINSIGNQIANLNEQIRLYEVDGSNANDLRDQRALLVDELSGYVNVEVEEIQQNDDYNAYDNTGGGNELLYRVKINGVAFVDGSEVNSLRTVEREADEKLNEMDAEGLYDIEFKNGQNFYKPSENTNNSYLEGELKGLLDLRDGNSTVATMYINETTGETITTNKYEEGVSAGTISAADYSPATTNDYKGLPHYMNKLNELVRTIAISFNEGTDLNGDALDGVIGHTDAYDLNGNKGNYFFSYSSGGTILSNESEGQIDYYDIDFTNICVNDAIVDDPSLFAAADAAGEPGNGNAVLGYMSIQDNDSLFDEGTMEDYVLSMSSELGIDLSQAEKFVTTYSELELSISNERLSESGVSLDEEIIDLTQNQLVFQAASQLITTINTVYDTLINVVGA